MSARPPYIIIGAGQSGAWAARSLRNEGYDGEIILIGNEPHAPYERPPLSKAVLTGTATLDDLTISDQAALTAQSVTFFREAYVDHLDPETKTVTLHDGRSLPYNKLFLCMGGRANKISTDAACENRILTLRNYANALALRNKLTPGARIGIIGGGWIGLETAASAKACGCNVTVFEAGDQLCGRSLPSDAAAWLQTYHEANGVRIACGANVEKIETTREDGLCITLTTGDTREVDTIIMAVGMTPNDEIAHAAGLACDRGIIVDQACRTSVPDILAAGDVTAFQSPRYGQRIRFESWQNAMDQAIAAAKSALGQNIVYDPVPKLWSEQYDLMIRIAGVFSPENDTSVEKDDQSLLCVSVDKTGRVRGIASANRMRDHRKLLKALEQGIRVDLLTSPEPTISLSNALG